MAGAFEEAGRGSGGPKSFWLPPSAAGRPRKKKSGFVEADENPGPKKFQGGYLRDGTPIAAPPPPAYYPQMVALAERVSAGTDLLRLDFLCTPSAFYVGEATPFSASRLDPRVEADVVELYLEGLAARARSAR